MYAVYNRFLNRQIPTNISFEVSKGESKNQVLSKIALDFNLSPTQIFFSKVYMFFNKNIQFDAGTYTFTTNITYAKLYNSIRGGVEQKKVTFLEGWRLEQNALYLRDTVNSDYATSYYNLAKKLEGNLYPNTYFIDVNAGAEALVNRQLTEFDNKTKNLFNVYSGNLSKEQIIILASIIEREEKNDQNKSIVAGILLKRYNLGMPLDVDATLQYALFSNQVGSFSTCLIQNDCTPDFWKKNITESDLETNSLYNTRGKVGLPPSPICSPSFSSVESVINPKNTDYYFYLHDNTGQIHYAVTLEEHIANINKYL